MARNNKEMDAFDKKIGIKIQNLRLDKGLSRQQLAPKLDITHQQLQKYEGAINRVSVGRLTLIARALDKDISYFFEQEDINKPNEFQRMRLLVSRNFEKIPDPRHKWAVNDLVRALSEI